MHGNSTPLTDDQLFEIYTKYQEGWGYVKLAKHYHISVDRLKYILYNFGCVYETEHRRNINYAKSQSDTIIERYKSGESSVVISKEYNVSHKTILKIVNSNGIKSRNPSEASRVYQLNEHFFDVIDTEEKAYFFGLLYADGNLSDTTNYITLSLQVDDGYLLQILGNIIQPTKPNREIIMPKSKPNCKNQSSISIVSRYMSDVLISYGLVPRKSLIKVFPQVILDSSEDIQRHFIRGYFDGNGSISITKRNCDNISFILSISSTLDMCNIVKNTIIKYCGDINISVNLHSKDININNYAMTVSSKIQAYEILTWLYKDSKYLMYRKYNRYLMLCNYLGEEPCIFNFNR